MCFGLISDVKVACFVFRWSEILLAAIGLFTQEYAMGINIVQIWGIFFYFVRVALCRNDSDWWDTII